MPGRVVHVLEAVDIHERHDDAVAADAVCSGYLALQGSDAGAASQCAGEVVHRRGGCQPFALGHQAA